MIDVPFHLKMQNRGWVKWGNVVDQGWFWDGDPDYAQVVVHVLCSHLTQKYFACAGQHGWSRPYHLSDLLGWWMKTI